MQKRKLSLLSLNLAVLTAGVGLTVAQEEKPGEKRPPRPEGAGGGAGSFLAQIDTDKDGSISKAEAGDRWDRMSRLDKNEDGVIDKEELAAMAGGGRGSGGPEGGQRRPGGGQMFEEADKNGDGKLSKDEVPEEAWARIGKADKDGDNAVTREEITALFAGGGESGRPPGGGADRLFEMADKNKDGKITAEEAGERWERMSKLDKNSDGAITKEEVPKGPAPGGQPGQAGGGRLFEMADKNKDGKITAEEAGERWERLSKLDKNGDGGISKDEVPQAGAGGPGAGGGRPGGEGGGRGGDPGAVIGQFDKDEDEKLSKDEVSPEMWARLSKADSNADGLVSKDELSSVYSAARGGAGDAPRPDAKPKKKRPEVE